VTPEPPPARLAHVGGSGTWAFAYPQYRGDQVYAVALLAALLSFLVYSAVHVVGRRLDWQNAERDRA
jgi:hypothetical protein